MACKGPPFFIQEYDEREEPIMEWVTLPMRNPQTVEENTEPVGETTENISCCRRIYSSIRSILSPLGACFARRSVN